MATRREPNVTETEQELVEKAQLAVSRCNWVVGECAAKWTKKYARGRTDCDFAAKIGLSSDQVYQRRRVWEAFRHESEQFPSLKWSHFYTALNWQDAQECLEWAQENNATVAEMKAWRRATHGEDLSDEPPPDDFAGDPSILFVPSERRTVRDLEMAGTGERREGSRPAGRSSEADERVAGVARQSEQGGEPRRPDRGTAGSTREGAAGAAIAEKPSTTAEQQLKRMTGALERMNQALTAATVREMRKLPQAVRDRFVKAVGELNTKAAKLL